MHRLAATRGVRGFVGRHGRSYQIAAELAFGLVVGVLTIGLRMIVDIVIPGAGPFAIIYPSLLIATLYGRWVAGLIAFAIGLAWAWWWVLPPSGSFILTTMADTNRLLMNAICAAITLFLAEAFRRAVERAAGALDAEVERRGNMMLEFTHRTKNNFAMLASLLQTQAREQETREARLGFELAGRRVFSFAKTYDVLAEGVLDHDRVAMRSYIERLLPEVERSLFDGSVAVTHEIANLQLPKSKALAIGLLLNESMTNAAKYAFDGVATPQIDIRLEGTDERWSFAVADNGVGVGPQSIGNLGSRLMLAFADQAGAQLMVEDAAPGTRVVLSFFGKPLAEQQLRGP